MRRGALRVAAVLLVGATLVASSAPGSLDEDESVAPSAASSAEADSAARMAARGLAFLAKNQLEDRSFRGARGENFVEAPLAVTALATLAFMAGGSTMGRGPYAEKVRSGIGYLLDNMVEVQFEVTVDGVTTSVTTREFYVTGDSTSRMHGHGYATLALAQAYGTLDLDETYGELAPDKARDDRKRMRDALVDAVRLIELSQGNQGGWYYDPHAQNHEGSVTITMIQALRAARDVGIDVNKSVIDSAVKYVHDSQKQDDGSFRYQINSPESSYALTAAAIATLNSTGDYDSRVIDLGMDYMRRKDPILNPDRFQEAQRFVWYARVYAAQAYWQYRDANVWKRWRPLLLAQLESEQSRSSDGHFPDDDYGSVFGTACACLVLQIPFQYLPMYQR